MNRIARTLLVLFPLASAPVAYGSTQVMDALFCKAGLHDVRIEQLMRWEMRRHGLANGMRVVLDEYRTYPSELAPSGNDEIHLFYDGPARVDFDGDLIARGLVPKVWVDLKPTATGFEGSFRLESPKEQLSEILTCGTWQVYVRG